MGSDDKRTDSVDTVKTTPEGTPLTKARAQAKENMDKAKQMSGSMRKNVTNFLNKPSKDVEEGDRDVNGIHDDLKVQFSDVIAEPDGTVSMTQVWNGSARGYRFGRKICYNIMSLIFGIPLAIFWGAYFALVAFINIWCCVPCVKSLTIQFKFISTVWGLLVNTILDPIFVSMGRIFGSIKLTIRNDKAESIV